MNVAERARLPAILRVIPLLAISWMIMSPAEAGEISDRLDKLARSLSAGYDARRPNAPSEPVAVFPLNSSNELAKQRVGFATSELLTHHFAARPEFTMVERSRLAEVIEEQRLHVSGAIEPSKAIRLGKVVGARLVVLGSVEKLGGQYQVNVRIVDVESTEVLATAYEEMPARLFEEIAQPYLVPVPDEQAIGLYFLANYRYNRNESSAYFNQPWLGGNTNHVAPRGFPLSMLGGGVRYFPWQHWMIDASAAVFSGSQQVESVDGPNGFFTRRNVKSAILIRGTLNWIHPWNSRLRGILGAGLASYKVTATNISFDAIVVPSMRAGLEYRPQPRVGIGFFGNYDVLGRDGKDSTPPYDRAFKLDRWSIEPTLALYF